MLTLQLVTGETCRLRDGVWQVTGPNAVVLQQSWLMASRVAAQTVPPSVNPIAREGEKRGFWRVIAYEDDGGGKF